jgi:hypothetical protein
MGRPASLAAIVNAGWFYRIIHGQDRPVQTAEEARDWSNELDTLNELILKAIELRGIRERLQGRSRTDGDDKHA